MWSIKCDWSCYLTSNRWKSCSRRTNSVNRASSCGSTWSTPTHTNPIFCCWDRLPTWRWPPWPSPTWERRSLTSPSPLWRWESASCTANLTAPIRGFSLFWTHSPRTSGCTSCWPVLALAVCCLSLPGRIGLRCCCWLGGSEECSLSV